jgi:hypothetical protein
MRNPRRAALGVLLAILGIALAAAITWGTSQLVSQRIGLASEPLTAGSSLLPRSAAVPTTPPRASTAPKRPARTVTVTTPAPVVAPVPTTATQAPALEPPAASEGSKPAEGSGSEGDRQVHRDD